MIRNDWASSRDFFPDAHAGGQCKVERAAMVASLITSDVVSNDPTGVEVLRTLEACLSIVWKEGAEPVVASRRFGIAAAAVCLKMSRLKTTRRAVVDSLTGAMQKLPLRDSQKDQTAYDRLLEILPISPGFARCLLSEVDATGVNFQRTRGMLRMFAIALRASDGTGFFCVCWTERATWHRWRTL